MLQAYIDDSKSDGKLFVLAGYVAPAEAWAAFSDEWKAELDQAPALGEFKMAEMNRRSSWNPNTWERCGRFYSIIERHVSAAISVTIPLDGFANAVRGSIWPPGMENPEAIHSPYWWAYQAIITSLARHQDQLGLTEPVDLVFDEQSERAHGRGTWEDYKGTAPPEEQRVMGDPPIFRRSHSVMPLQAADLYAWWVRRWIVDGVSDGLERLAFKWSITRDLIRYNCDLDEDSMRRNVEGLNQRIWATFAARNLHFNPWACSYPRWAPVKP